MYFRYALLTWVSCLALPEILGMTIYSFLSMLGYDGFTSIGLSTSFIVASRFLLLYLVSRISNVDLGRAVYIPYSIQNIRPIIYGIFILFLLEYGTAIVLSKPYTPQLMELAYYIENGVPWLFPANVAYYFSEIVVLNYMYILSREGLEIIKLPFTGGMVFLIVGWALPHILTKSLFIAIYAVVLVFILYIPYEYTRSPLTPIILWFITLIL